MQESAFSQPNDSNRLVESVGSSSTAGALGPDVLAPLIQIPLTVAPRGVPCFADSSPLPPYFLTNDRLATYYDA